jgi:S-adenosylmethionine decarboxylase
MSNNQPDHFKSDAAGNAYAGDHLLVELWDAHRLSDAAFIERTLAAAARAAEATVLHSYYHPFGEGQGVSGVTILAESHISIHTWPERGYAAIDVFMCGDCDPRLTLPVLERAFRPGRVETRLFKRGTSAARAFQSVA